MSVAYLGIGSNTDAERNVRSAVAALRDRFSQVVLSPIYLSRAVGFAGDDFINLVAQVETDLPPLALRDYLRELEDRHGRRRDLPKFSDRTLDIDILIYDDLVLDTPDLQLPRPEIRKFAHVLKPLVDLAPELRYPGRGETLAELWAAAACREVALEPLDPGLLEA